MSDRLTRQGVRDLNAIGPKPKRGHVGLPPQPRPCFHEWEQKSVEQDDDDGIINNILLFRDVCRLCGVVRR